MKSEGKHSLPVRIKNSLIDVFTRDVALVKIQIAKLVVRGLILAGLFTFWVDFFYFSQPNHEFTSIEQWIAVLVCGFSLLFGGIFTDTLIEKHGVFEKIALIILIPMLLMLYVQFEPIVVIATMIFGVILALLVILFFTGLLINTTMLNRARVITFLLLIMTVFIIPTATAVVLIQDNTWIWIVFGALCLVSLWVGKKYPRPTTPYLKTVRNQDRKPSLREFIKITQESATISSALFLLFISMTTGFYTSSAVYSAPLNTVEILWLILFIAITLVIIAIVLDTVGRKPVMYFSLGLLGLIAIFFDYPAEAFIKNPVLQLGITTIVAITVLLSTAVFAGDLSARFSRGRITGFFLFMTVFGAVAGVIIRNQIGTPIPENLTIILSDWTALAIIVAIFLFIRTKDRFEPEARNWRGYLVRLQVFTENGLSLVYQEFNAINGKETSQTVMEDLASGGITGASSIIQEISNSRQRISVIDHGDVHLIFHYGDKSVAVLFVKQTLVIFREKLANFHLNFEHVNKDNMYKDHVEVSALQNVEALIKESFD